MTTLTKWIAAPLGALALGLAAPLAAQSNETSGDMSSEDMAAFTQMMGGMFEEKPLTPEEEARLPLASGVVAKLLPPGFYTEIMEDMMGGTMKPLLSLFSGPEFVVMGSVSLDDGIPDLSEAELAEVAAMLDPAYASRADTMISAMTEGMGEMFAVMEDPMREGMTEYYARRFTGLQLSEIDSFFSTPTGALYARESIAMAADPQFMSSMMGSVPDMMGEMGDMEARMEAAMASIPQARGFADLSAAERSRLAGLLSVSVAELQTAMERAQADQEE